MITHLSKLASDAHKQLRKDGCYDSLMWNQFYIIDNGVVWRVHISNEIWRFEQSSSSAMESWAYDVAYRLAEDYFDETSERDFVIKLMGKEYDVWVEADGDYATDFDIRAADDGEY